MNLATKVRQFDSIRARTAVRWLAKNLTLPVFVGTTGLVVDVRENIENHVDWLTKEPAACKAVEYFAADCAGAEHSGCPIEDPPLVFNASALLYLLLIAYERAGAIDATLLRLGAAHEATLRHYLQLSSAQVDAFCGCLGQVQDFLYGLQLSNTRLVLVDMPVGNTLAVCLLKQLLSPLCRVELMRVALQRNTSRTLGPTRQQLLESKLVDLALRPNDIVLYFDEWSTGVNFNAMCQIQRKFIPREAFFLPVAALTESSVTFDRYASFCNDHDSLLKKWGRSGAEFRKILPPVASVSQINGYFFWSEKDRMAGIRKLQVHGSMFSSLDATIEHLHSNEDVLKVALGFQLGDFVREGLLAQADAKNIKVLFELFQEGYEDYHACRDDLRRCGDETADGGELDDIAEGLEPISPNYGALLNGRKAKIAVIIAFYYNRRFGSLDPDDRYYFKTHAPVVIPLTGRMAKVHEVTLKFLSERLPT